MGIMGGQECMGSYKMVVRVYNNPPPLPAKCPIGKTPGA